MQKAVTARADTAENICSLGSLVSFRRSFWYYREALIHREGQTGQPCKKIGCWAQQLSILEQLSTAVAGYPNSTWPSFMEIVMKEWALLDGWMLTTFFSSETFKCCIYNLTWYQDKRCCNFICVWWICYITKGYGAAYNSKVHIK